MVVASAIDRGTRARELSRLGAAFVERVLRLVGESEPCWSRRRWPPIAWDSRLVGVVPLVLSNSLGTDHSLWDFQLAAFGCQHSVERYDTRGHGGPT